VLQARGDTEDRTFAAMAFGQLGRDGFDERGAISEGATIMSSSVLFR
jgi:hypothetical protein